VIKVVTPNATSGDNTKRECRLSFTIIVSLPSNLKKSLKF